MIYYFSATGNSQWVAEELAAATGDRAVSMTDMKKQKLSPSPVRAGETLGLVFPVYAFAPPRVVMDFVSQLQIEEGAFVYGVCTMADFCGDVFRYLRKAIHVDSCYSIRMPSNYIVMSDCEPDEKVASKIMEATGRIPKIAAAVKAHKKEFIVRKGPMAYLLTAFAAPFFRKFAKDKKFLTDDTCIGCGKCVERCPMDNIKLENNRPAWQGDCMQCMGCIQNCARQAINYGNQTRNRKRYTCKVAKNGNS